MLGAAERVGDAAPGPGDAAGPEPFGVGTGADRSAAEDTARPIGADQRRRADEREMVRAVQRRMLEERERMGGLGGLIR